MNNFKGKKIAVIGEGLEGKSSASFLKRHGAEVEIRDKTQGENYLKDLDKLDFIVRSPGVRISELITHNSELITPKITSQTKLFFDLCPAKVIGVTGTKGKGTTSTLIYEMLKKEGFDVYLGGNIGVPPFEFLEKLTPDSWVVLEMSSFQLQDLTKSPHIAVVLMITSEHLDYHKDTLGYVEAKRNIVNHQTQGDFAVVNRDYVASNESDMLTSGKVYYVSREREVEEGAFALGNQIILRINGNTIPVVDTRELLLKGDHNHENACAGAMAAYLAGVRVGTITSVLKTFKGLEHRIELVGKINGVEYYDDSIATNPESAIAAIKAFKEPKVLILGGVTEGSSFAGLGEEISQDPSILAVIGIGKEWPAIKAAIKNPKPHLLLLEGATSMHQVVEAAYKFAKPGDVVLLSPACKSFDMFKNYKDRGNQFKDQVHNLKQDSSK